MFSDKEQEFLENLEQYRIDKNLKATNKVFIVNFLGDAVVVKQPGKFSTLANAYYVFQDQFFFGTRKFSTAKQRLEREAKVLDKLDGLYAPQLLFHTEDYKLIVKEYLFGDDFRTLYWGNSTKIRARFKLTDCLEKALEGMYQIHELGITLGDAHVKNVFYTDRKESYWVDFDGVFDESDFEKSKAIDLLKFIYSTFSVSRSTVLTNYSAKIASQYPNKKTKELAAELIENRSSLGLWFPTRIPILGNLNEEIKKIIH